MLRSEFQKLSSNLTSLHLRGRSVVEALFPNRKLNNPSNTDLPTGESELIEPASKRCKPMENDENNQTHLFMWNLDTTWPCLVSLSLQGDISYQLDSSVFSLLPRSLLELNFQSRFSQAALEDLSGLPSGLRAILFRSGTIDLCGLLTLPKSITCVCNSLSPRALHAVVACPEILPLLARLPRALKNRDGERSDPLASLKPGTRLPEAIQHTFAENPDMNLLLTQLPSRLCGLTIYGPSLNHELVAALPRTLTLLQVGNIDWTGLDLTLWPPNLQRLYLGAWPDFNYHSFSLLPRSLVKLEFCLNYAPTSEEALEVDTTLLEEIGRKCLAADQDRWMVEKLKLKNMYGKRSEPYIARIEAGELYGLPVSLTFLLDKTPYHCLPKHLLPPLIPTYHYSWKLVLNDPQAFNYLPLSDDFIIHIGRNHDFPPPTGITEQMQSYEQSALRTAELLKLRIYHTRTHLNVVEYLPTTLTYLTLHGCEFSINMLRHLPPLLKTLEFRHCQVITPRGEAVVYDWVESLPRSLITLRLTSSAPIHGKEILKLPPKLETLRAAFDNLEFSHARHFPPNMRKITIPTHFFHEFEMAGCRMLHELQSLCRPFWRIREYTDDYLLTELSKVTIPHRWEGPPPPAVTDIDSRTTCRLSHLNCINVTFKAKKSILGSSSSVGMGVVE